MHGVACTYGMALAYTDWIWKCPVGSRDLNVLSKCGMPWSGSWVKILPSNTPESSQNEGWTRTHDNENLDDPAVIRCLSIWSLFIISTYMLNRNYEYHCWGKLARCFHHSCVLAIWQCGGCGSRSSPKREELRKRTIVIKKILLTKFPINRPLQSFGPAHIRATKEHHADISTDIFTES